MKIMVRVDLEDGVFAFFDATLVSGVAYNPADKKGSITFKDHPILWLPNFEAEEVEELAHRIDVAKCQAAGVAWRAGD